MTHEAWNAGKLPEGARVVATSNTTTPPVMPPSVAGQFAFFKRLASDPAYYQKHMGLLLEWLEAHGHGSQGVDAREAPSMTLERKKQIAHQIVGTDPQSEVTALRIINAVLFELCTRGVMASDRAQPGHWHRSYQMAVERLALARSIMTVDQRAELDARWPEVRRELRWHFGPESADGVMASDAKGVPPSTTDGAPK